MLSENSHWLVNVKLKFQLCKKKMREMEGDSYLLSICVVNLSFLNLLKDNFHIYRRDAIVNQMDQDWQS